MIGVARASSTRQLILLATAQIGTTAGAQSYVIPSGTRYIDIELFGAGGGGAAGRAYTASKANYQTGGGGGGGGGYVRYGFTGAIGGDVLNFTIGNGGTGGTYDNIANSQRPGLSGGNTSLTSLTRQSATVISFTDVIVYGGFGGQVSNSSANSPGGTGGVGTGGNITNRNGTRGNHGTSTVEDFMNGTKGGKGGTGATSDSNASADRNGGTGGIGDYAIENQTAAVAGGNAIANLMGAGGGGGAGYPVSSSNSGAAGGIGGIRVRSYG